MIEWNGCYSDSWQGVITPDAFAHPAKFARGLIRRIYQHMLERGYLSPGDSVIDPFGGVGLGGLDAMTLGLHFTGVELEERFCLLGNANIDKWRRDLAMLNGKLGTARLLQGDSRRLTEIIVGAGGVVSSPPYDANTVHSDSNATQRHAAKGGESGRWGHSPIGVMAQGDYGSTPGQLGSMRSGDFGAAVSSPPFGEGETRNRSEYQPGFVADMMSRAYTQDRQGDTPGNLAALRADESRFDAALSSPPYANAIDGSGEGPGARHDPIFHNGDNAYKASSANGYGTAAGNLGNMAAGGFEGAVSSPPYEGSINANEAANNSTARLERKAAAGIDVSKSFHRGGPNSVQNQPQNYGNTSGQLGSDTGETFWIAARVILEQTYSVLRPGGYAAWVTKRFVRNGAIVEFSEQWAQLCEAVGFVRVEWIRAMLVESHGAQLDIFGDSHKREKKRASFFRRLYEQKYPHNAIDWEDVVILRKPLFARANANGATQP
jgi:hypothetical protein